MIRSSVSSSNQILLRNRNDDKSWQHNRDFIFNWGGSCGGHQSPVRAGSVKVTRIWLIISVRTDPQSERGWSPMEEAIVDTHCSTSADKWAFVSIATTDSKRRGGELSIDCPKRRGRLGTGAVLPDAEEIHLQITDRWRGPLFQEERGCLCANQHDPIWPFQTCSTLYVNKSKYTQIWHFSANILYFSAAYPVICLLVLKRFQRLVGIWEMNIL